MNRGTILFVSSAPPRELTRSLPFPEQAIRICLPDEVRGLLAEEIFDIILFDGSRNHSRDFSLLADMKMARPEVPILYLSESAADGTAIEAFRHGARDYYHKPVNILRLRESIESLLTVRNGSRWGRTPLLHLEREGTGWTEEATSNLPLSILKVIVYMEDHLEENLSLVDLAGQAGFSRFHFCREFKKHMGRSPFSYLTLLRMERAKKLMRRNELTVSDIASAVGYNDVSNFSRKFKEVSGVTPTLFRKKRLEAVL